MIFNASQTPLAVGTAPSPKDLVSIVLTFYIALSHSQSQGSINDLLCAYAGNMETNETDMVHGLLGLTLRKSNKKL